MNTLRVILRDNTIFIIDLSKGLWADTIRMEIEQAGYKYPKDILRVDKGEDAPNYHEARQLIIRSCCS